MKEVGESGSSKDACLRVSSSSQRAGCAVLAEGLQGQRKTESKALCPQ